MLEDHTRDENDGLFRGAMACSNIGMAIVDAQGRWLEINPALERMLGHTAAELVGHPITEQVHRDDIASAQAALQALVDGHHAAMETDIRYLRCDGSVVTVHLDIAAIRGCQGETAGFFCHLRDIGGERDTARALQRMNDSLEQCVAARDLALDTARRDQELLAYGISHDLRAPLRVIDSFAALLSNHEVAARDDTVRDHLARIRGAAQRMGGLIDALLTLSRVSSTPMREETVDLSLLADWALAELSDADPGRTNDLDVQPGLRVRGDERQLKTMLDQLLHNAWKFSHERDRVVIGMHGERQGTRLHVVIRDQGSGFDTRYADKMFEPFQRLHGAEHGGGNGIGLAIARRIAERHGGRLWAESEPGVGSTFHLELDAAMALPEQGS